MKNNLLKHLTYIGIKQYITVNDRMCFTTSKVCFLNEIKTVDATN